MGKLRIPGWRRNLAISILGVGCTATLSATELRPPETLREEGVCPFECCTYREWTVLADTPLRAAPDETAKFVARARKGTKVDGLTGIVVVTRPGEIEVLRDYTSADSGHAYRRGDRVRVYTERGEGFFRVWHDGESYDEEAAFLYQDRGGWASCVDAGTCWGRRVSFPESIWWVQVRTKEGAVGWTRRHENFGDMDACG